MPETDAALELVRDDVTQGLTAWVEPQSNDHGFAVLRRDEDDLSHLLSSPLGDVAVPWTWTGVHRGLEGDDDRDVMGYQPTGKTIEVRGVTIVSDRDGEVTFARFVDWVSALAEIGVPLLARPVVDDPGQDPNH
jgi:hypothetical protein